MDGGFELRRYDDPRLVDGEQVGAALSSAGSSDGPRVYLSYHFPNAWFARAGPARTRRSSARGGGR